MMLVGKIQKISGGKYSIPYQTSDGVQRVDQDLIDLVKPIVSFIDEDIFRVERALDFLADNIRSNSKLDRDKYAISTILKALCNHLYYEHTMNTEMDILRKAVEIEEERDKANNNHQEASHG